MLPLRCVGYEHTDMRQVWMDIFNSYYIPDIDGSSPVVSSRKRAKENAKLKLEAKQQEVRQGRKDGGLCGRGRGGSVREGSRR